MSRRRKKSSNPIPKKEKIKSSLTTERNARVHIKILKESNIPFVLTCSNYTTRIESPVMNRKFVYSMQTNRCFAAFSKVKKDVRDKPIPEIDKSKLTYFEHDFKDSCSIDRVYNIDLKSAYATVLFKDGLISKETFSYLKSLPKHDRLVSVGMLASKKKTFGFDKSGIIRTYESRISDFENFFYYAVRRTFEIMQQLKALIGLGYLFTWVDGIYFIPNMDALIRCENYLRSIGYPYSEEILSDWQIRMVKGAVKLTFVKDRKIKSFSLPAKESEFSSIMMEAMREMSPVPKKLELKISKNEKSLIAPSRGNPRLRSYVHLLRGPGKTR